MNSLAFFGNLAGGDGLIIFIVILLLFGAKRLPELAKGLGSAVREFSKAKDEIEHEITRQATPPPRQIEPQRDIHPQTAQTSTDDPYHSDPYHSDPYHQEQYHQEPVKTVDEPKKDAGASPAGGPTIPV